MSSVTVRRPARLEGRISLPGDKSISHRALLLNAIADGEASVAGLSEAADVRSTEACLRALGVEVDHGRVVGRGLHGLRAAAGPLDCGNSGTTMRLLGSLLAVQPFESVLVGDESLSRRPMGRIAEPLRMMGARCEPGPPLRVGGGQGATGITYEMPVASAQVKSGVLLAGLYAEGATRVVEPYQTRDHTERMLRAMGAPVEASGTSVTVRRTERLKPLPIEVPGDISAAAFWLVAGGLHPAGWVSMSVGANPTRTAILEVLQAAGFRLRVMSDPVVRTEPSAGLEVAGPAAEPRPLEISGALTAGLIDELPVLAVAAALLPGRSSIRDARELRVKESDRIAAVCEGLAAMGAGVTPLEDGLEVEGGARLQGARVRSHGDHRIAMAMAVAGMLAEGETVIEGAECVDVSYPGFWEQVERMGALA